MTAGEGTVSTPTASLVEDALTYTGSSTADLPSAASCGDDVDAALNAPACDAPEQVDAAADGPEALRPEREESEPPYVILVDSTPQPPHRPAARTPAPVPSGTTTPALPAAPRNLLEGGSAVPRHGDSSPPIIDGYVILRELGQGGMGRVYLAREQGKLGRCVALKTLLGHSTEAVERLFHEAQAAAALNHPNIVPVYHCGGGATPFYTMQYVEREGGSPAFTVKNLISRLREADAPGLGFSALLKLIGVQADPAPGELGPAAAADRPYFRLIAHWIAGVAEGLEAIHRAGMLHRDIKPSNLLLCRDGRMMIADFGLAKSEQTPDLTMPGMIPGSQRYMAPELKDRRQEHHDVFTDVYSLGLTLCELLALPPGAPKSRAVARAPAHSKKRPDAVVFGPRVPAELARIGRRATEAQRRRRYPSAGALAADLRAWLNGIEPRSPRRWAWTAGLATGAFAAAVTLAWMLTTNRPDREGEGAGTAPVDVTPTPPQVTSGSDQAADQTAPVIDSSPDIQENAHQEMARAMESPKDGGGESVAPPEPRDCTPDPARRVRIAVAGRRAGAPTGSSLEAVAPRGAQKLHELLVARSYRPRVEACRLESDRAELSVQQVLSLAAGPTAQGGSAPCDFVLYVTEATRPGAALVKGDPEGRDTEIESRHEPGRWEFKRRDRVARSQDVPRRWDIEVIVEAYRACDGRKIDEFAERTDAVGAPGTASMEDAIRSCADRAGRAAIARVIDEWK